MRSQITRALSYAIVCGVLLICAFAGGAAAADERSFEERIRILEHELTRLQDVDAIQRVMARYEAIHNPTDMTKTYMVFAKRPDTIFVGSGYTWIGYESIKSNWLRLGAEADKRGVKGTMFEHPLATPNIVVAGDGQTAKATWVSPGHETMKGTDGKLTGQWCYGKYAIDFIKMDGEWRIWHLRWIRNFMTPYDTSWVDNPIPENYTKMDENGNPLFPNPYMPDSILKSIPAAPKPYQTWSEAEEGWYLRETIEP